ncbi:MAG: TIGR03936 family radical SAM-associated protein [Chloroflexi bacterium]|nr:TIGR03936 family radical SAM-associated protein [Chloroflexota bacterium]
MQRIRIQYEKGEELQYIGNLDLHKVWERTFRRAQIQLAYTMGFHPQPRIHQACPLPLGFTSVAETLDFWCNSDETLEEFKIKLNRALPPGIIVISLSSIPLNHPPLQALVIASEYCVSLSTETDMAIIKENIERTNLSEHCIRERRGKQYDLRLLLKILRISDTNPYCIEMVLSTLPGATGRPEEVLEVLGINPYIVDIKRKTLIFSETTEKQI